MIEKGGSSEVMREAVDTASEFIFLGLRLNKGIDLDQYRRRCNIDIEERYRDELRRLTEAELIEIQAGHLKLTPRGMLFSNEVFAVFV